MPQDLHSQTSKTWQGNMERHLARETWCLWKLRNSPSPSQPVGAWVENTECNARCNGPGTVEGRARFQVPLKRPGLKRDFFLAKTWVCKFIKGKWQAHLDKYLKLMLVKMLGWYPGLRKMQKVNFIEVQRPKDEENFCPSTPAAQQPDRKKTCSVARTSINLLG